MATPSSHYGLDATNFFIVAMLSAFGVFVTIHLVRNQWEPASH